MMRFLVLFLAFALVSGPAHAGPVAAAISIIGTWVGNVLAAGGFGAFLLRTGASIALSMLAMALSKKKQPMPSGIKTEGTTSGGTTPQKFILGLNATGGQLIAPPMSYTNPGQIANSNLVYVVVLSVVPGCTFQRLIVDDAWAPLGAPAAAGWGHNVTGRLAGRCLVDYLDGSQTGPHSGLMAQFAADPDRPWSADMVGPGTCYAVLNFGYNREYYNGLPQVRFEMMGIPVYDPRADSTVGGSGPQRWSDPATWTQSANPAVLIYNIMRGIDVGAGLRWGGECAAEDLPPDSWFAAMNACDLAIEDGAGGTVPQYRGGIEVALDDEPAAIIEELLKAACAQMSEIGGIWKIRVGGPAMPTYVLSDDDVLVSEEQEFDPFPSLADTWNGISCTYPDPESLWESKEAPPRYNATWEAEDGGRRLVADLRLPACPYPEQVQRVMVASIADHRRMRQHRIGMPPEAAVLEPLDSVGWTSARYGYTGKTFEVSRITDNLMTLNQGLHLRERDSSDFDWSPSELIPPDTPTVITTPAMPEALAGFAVAGTVVTDADAAARRPAITLSWNPDGALGARGILWEVRLAVETAASLSGTFSDPSSGQVRLVAGLLPATQYRVRARPILDRATAWTSWLAVTTPDVRIGAGDLAMDVVETLEETLEAAAVAEVSRAAAQAAESGAVLARNLAQTAASEAGTARMAAQGAATAALASETAARASETSAAGSATAASGSANTASGHATAAGVSATAAAASATSAGTHAGNAATSATQAATSATNAAGSAASAATNASTTAAILTDAQRALASASTVINGRASAVTLPFGTLVAGTVDAYVVQPATVYSSDAEGVYLARSMAAAGAAVCLRAVVPSSAEAVYRVTVKVRLSAANSVRLLASWVNADGTTLSNGVYLTTAVAAGTVTTLTMILGRQAGGVVTQAGGGTLWAAAAALRFGVQGVNAVAGATMQVYEILVDDLTQADLAARSATGAAGSASAAASSASSAAASQTAAGTSASAAQTAQAAAETARGQAQTHATNAATSATSAQGAANAAAISQGAAATSATSSGASATAAANSASIAGTKASEAGSYAAEALDYRNTAARLTGGGVSKNPVFNDWSGAVPANVVVTAANAGTVNKITTGTRRYINALEFDATNPAANGPILQLNTALAGSLDCSLSPRGILLRAEIEYMSGNLAESGAALLAAWQDTAGRNVVRYLKELITPTPGIVQVVELCLERPAAAVPASATAFAASFFGHSTLGGHTGAALKTRIHRFDFEEVLVNSQTSIYQQAVASLAGIQSAVIGFRAQAGSAGAVLELVAASDPTGATSLARIDADNILLDGTVTAELMNVGWLVGGRISASYLDVDSLLTIQAGAGLRYQKPAVSSDGVDGLYFGFDGGRFGFAASRTTNNRRQSIKLASTTGLELLNARHLVSGQTVPVPVLRTTALAKTALPAGIVSIMVDLVGGGGGGASQAQFGRNIAGANGAATVVRLYDGATLKHTFQADGGAGGSDAIATSGQNSFQHSAFNGIYGNSGSGGIWWNSDKGRHYYARAGAAGAFSSSETIDVTSWANPQIEVVIGAGGAGGSAAGNTSGQAGQAGAVLYSYVTAKNIPADVVPLEPTAVGSFVTSATGAGSFPDLGPGLWILHRNTAGNGVGLGYVTLAPGNTVRAHETGTVTLISGQTPTYSSAQGSWTVFYSFYSMGSWG